MNKKAAMANFKTVDDYILRQSNEAQIILQQRRSPIKEMVRFRREEILAGLK